VDVTVTVGGGGEPELVAAFAERRDEVSAVRALERPHVGAVAGVDDHVARAGSTSTIRTGSGADEIDTTGASIAGKVKIDPGTGADIVTP
jgi:hypothetical protein